MIECNFCNEFKLSKFYKNFTFADSEMIGKNWIVRFTSDYFIEITKKDNPDTRFIADAIRINQWDGSIELYRCKNSEYLFIGRITYGDML